MLQSAYPDIYLVGTEEMGPWVPWVVEFPEWDGASSYRPTSKIGNRVVIDDDWVEKSSFANQGIQFQSFWPRLAQNLKSFWDPFHQ